ncbi:hypothetical protein HGRIS_002589 [Hohenbuehelia grisea]|uniref:Cytochrome P450 n=1 Tax=Hohenbuehelia grisea TaxID=104357 RepID=A0ABR3JN08_9AGAR
MPLAIGIALVLLAFLVYQYVSKSYEKSNNNYPTGPKPEYIFFNDVPTSKAWLTYNKMVETYGPIFRLKTPKDDIVVVSDRKVVEDLLEKRSRVYSDRPAMSVFELAGWSWNLAFMPYADRWRRHRRIMHQHFRPQAAVRYRHHELDNVHHLLRSLLDHPVDFWDHLRMFVSSAPLSLIYGYQAKELDDPFITTPERAGLLLSNIVNFGGAIADVFPVLHYLPSWFPGAGFKRHLSAAREMTQEMRNAPALYCMKQMQDGASHDCLLANLLREQEQANHVPTIDQETLINVATISYVGKRSTPCHGDLTI